MPTTLLINIFYLDLKFEKSTIELHFFSYILHAYKIFKPLKTNSYVINQLFQF